MGEAPVDSRYQSRRRREAHRRASRDAEGPRAEHSKAAPTDEPLADLQWDMQQIGATPTARTATSQGKGVRVGIIDTGVDGTHPDIAPNFDRELSRNFTTDIPVDANGDEIDGPCEHPTCIDPADVDDDGHGTHVAVTIAAPINGLGIAGVAPKATIVNLRAGQDSGFFFLQPSRRRADVRRRPRHRRRQHELLRRSVAVQLRRQPGRLARDQAEQRTIITAMQRALDYAHRHGVTLVSAAGNGAPTTPRRSSTRAARTSPRARRGAYPRTIPPSLPLDAVRGPPT